MRRRRQPSVSFESLESRIALSMANDHNPLYGVSNVAPPQAITYRAQAVVAAPVVSASSASLSQSAGRITLNGTGFDRRPGHNVVAFDGGVTGKVVSATPTALVVRLTHKPSGTGVLSTAVTTNGRSSGAPVSVANIVTPPRVTIGFPTLPRPGKLTAIVTANDGSSGQSAQVATVDSANLFVGIGSLHGRVCRNVPVQQCRHHSGGLCRVHRDRFRRR